uniref:Uncharacterized protein n=1 Tax=Arundo donax TaxID=35708 RepID=A0A0A8ZCJ6_ARUDO
MYHHVEVHVYTMYHHVEVHLSRKLLATEFLPILKNYKRLLCILSKQPPVQSSEQKKLFSQLSTSQSNTAISSFSGSTSRPSSSSSQAFAYSFCITRAAAF